MKRFRHPLLWDVRPGLLSRGSEEDAEGWGGLFQDDLEKLSYIRNNVRIEL